jgi:beta-phosphoglucomutase-like phosphatase (HAD superfamily)
MMLPRTVKAVVFDMDGLLFDTESLYREAMQATALRFGVEMSDATFLRMIGLPAEASRLLLIDHYGSDFDVERFWIESATIFRALGEGRRYLKPGVVELLDRIDALKLTRAIATSSGHGSVERNLTRHGLTARFHAIVAHGDYTRGKPNPDPYMVAAERLGVAPEHCLALEDSHNGVRSAAAAGMMTVMVPDLLPPDDDIRKLCVRVVRDLHEVRALVGTPQT